MHFAGVIVLGLQASNAWEHLLRPVVLSSTALATAALKKLKLNTV